MGIAYLRDAWPPLHRLVLRREPRLQSREDIRLDPLDGAAPTTRPDLGLLIAGSRTNKPLRVHSASMPVSSANCAASCGKWSWLLCLWSFFVSGLCLGFCGVW